MGWFYGCKLHLVMNQFGEIVNSALSNGHIADIKMVEQLVEGFEAKLYADRGYTSQDLKSKLKEQGVDLITYHRKNMQSIQLYFAIKVGLRTTRPRNSMLIIRHWKAIETLVLNLESMV